MSFRNFLATGEQSILLPLSPAAGLPEVRTAPKDLEYALHPGAADAAISGGVRIESDICAVRDQHIHTTFRWGRDPRICCRRWERNLPRNHNSSADSDRRQSLAEFFAAAKKRNIKCFLRRHMRRLKHFSQNECLNVRPRRTLRHRMQCIHSRSSLVRGSNIYRNSQVF